MPAPCAYGWQGALYAKVRASVVRIERPDAGGGAGFFFRDNKHVATAFHVVDGGRAVQVRLVDGRTLDAEVVAADRRHDVALLELASAVAEGVPLERGPLPDVGAPLLGIGHPYGSFTSKTFEGLLNWSAVQGMVSARTADLLQVNMEIHPGNSGGPILDCTGRVVALVSFGVSGGGPNFAIPIAHVAALEPDARGFGTGGVSLRTDLALDIDLSSATSFVGPALGVGIVASDRWALRFTAGYLFGTSGNDADGAVVVRSRARIVTGATLGYRFLVLEHTRFAMYVVPALGVSYDGDYVRGTRFDIASDATGSRIVATDVSDHRYRWYPLARFGLAGRSGNELAYAYVMDTDRVLSSFHRITLGFGF